jgi:hypothetical protein
VEIVQYLLLIEIKWTTVKMECDVRQAAGIVGKRTLAFAGEFNGTLEFGVECRKLWNGNNGPFNKGVTFFS